MDLMMLRLCELRDEYFNQLNIHDLCKFHDSLEKDKLYSSNTLIKMLGEYTDKLYPPTWWIDPAGGWHSGYEADPAVQYK
jgi:hypothetical protein